MYFLANSEDRKSNKLAESNGFKLTDIRITFETELEHSCLIDQNNHNSIYPAALEDLEQLKRIASANHIDSRFYYDGNFPLQKCDEFFAAWIEKSFHGFADAVLVAKSGETVRGYVTCSIDDQGNGNIGLVGVNPVCRGEGVGKLLVNSALEWFAKKGVSAVTVVTQGRNVKAQRLYQSNGFLTESLKIWYHKWFNQNRSTQIF